MIAFESLRKDHLPLVREWLQREHVRRWWREPADSLAEYEAAIEGREPTDHYLIVLDGHPIGLIETYLTADYPESEEIVRVGPGVAGVDFLIGEQELTGQGLGPELIRAFVDRVVFADPGVHACVATPEEANRRSWRAFEKAGFQYVRDVEEKGLPHRLMRLDRSYAQ